MTKFGYARVSTSEQNEALQIDAFKREDVTHIYIDKGQSGLKYPRPELSKLMARISSDDILYIWHRDRLSRNPYRMGWLICELEDKGVKLVVLSERGIDTSSASGRFAINMIGLAAQYEFELRRERCEAGIQAAKKQGKHLGRKKELNDVQEARLLKLMVDKINGSPDSPPIKLICKELGISRTTYYLYRDRFISEGLLNI